MAKAKKSQTSTDQTADQESDAPEEIIDAEVVEAPSDSEDLAEDKEDTSEETAAVVIEDEPEPVESADSAQAEEVATAPEVEEEMPPSEAAVSEPPKEKSSSGFFPLFAGGIVAAAVGFGLSQYLGPFSTETDPAITELQTKLAEQTALIETLSAGQADVQTSQAGASEAVSTLAGSVDGMTASVAGLNGRIDDMANALSGIDGRITELEKRPITQSLPSSAIEAYERELEELKASVAAQRAEATAMEENAKQTAQEALARAALTRVLSALDTGLPFRAALIDFSTATGQPAPAALEASADTGAPSLASLQDGFPDAARRALGAARETSENGENRFVSFFKTQLGARSVTAKEGTDADAVLSRAEAALRNGNLTDALAEIDTLSDPALAELSDWLSQATARQSALAAGDALTQSLNSN